MSTANGARSDVASDMAEPEVAEPARSLSSVDTPAAIDADVARRVTESVDQVPSPLQLGAEVLRTLVLVERRPGRFQRLMRVWAGKVATAVRDGNLTDAAGWLNAVVEDPGYPADFQVYVDEAFDELSRPQVLDGLMRQLAASEDPEEGVLLVTSWGRRMVDYLIEGMVVEDPPVSRRHLVDHLAAVGRAHFQLVARHLDDPRWFIVRNAAIAVARTGRPEAAGYLEQVTGHRDDRVRVEALRGVVTLRGEPGIELVIEALRDSSSRVRHAAVSILRASPSEQVVPALIELLESGEAAPEEAPRLIEALAERKGAAVEPALEALAARKIAFGSSKAVRDAARAALDRRKR